MARRRLRRRERRERLDAARFRLDRVLWNLQRTLTRLRDLGEDEAAGKVWRSIEQLTDCRNALLARTGRR